MTTHTAIIQSALSTAHVTKDMRGLESIVQVPYISMNKTFLELAFTRTGWATSLKLSHFCVERFYFSTDLISGFDSGLNCQMDDVSFTQKYEKEGFTGDKHQTSHWFKLVLNIKMVANDPRELC